MKKESIGIALIVLIGIFTALAFAFTDRIPQDVEYHNFSDTQNYLSIPNALNVISNLPFLLVSVMGIFLLKEKGAENLNIVKSNTLAYKILFLGVALVGLGSGYYHLSPNNETLVWDRLPMTIAFMALYSIIISEFVSVQLGRKLLWPLLLAGFSSVFYWWYTELNHVGDLRFYAVVQFFPMLTIPVILLAFKSDYVPANKYWILLATYLLAKASEHFDAQIHEALFFISGHSIKHVLPAVGLYVLLKAFRNVGRI